MVFRRRDTHCDAGQGGEQGDALMPLLFSLGQHGALQSVASVLDDVYVVCAPERVSFLHSRLRTALWDFARIRINAGKTQLWNRAGEEPPGCQHLTVEARLADPTAVVWKGGEDVPRVHAGFASSALHWATLSTLLPSCRRRSSPTVPSSSGSLF